MHASLLWVLRPASRYYKALAGLLLLAAGITCSENPTGPKSGLRAVVGLTPVFSKAATEVYHNLVSFQLAIDNIHVRLNTTVVGLHGQDRLEAITVADAADVKETIPTTALFIFIGAMPHTEYLDGVVERDRQGFILTGPDLAPRPPGWSLDRRPFPLETSVPGIFAAGDVRHGSVKRVAAGVGEGATAVRSIHMHLESSASTRPSSSMETGAARTELDSARALPA